MPLKQEGEKSSLFFNVHMLFFIEIARNATVDVNQIEPETRTKAQLETPLSTPPHNWAVTKAGRKLDGKPLPTPDHNLELLEKTPKMTEFSQENSPSWFSMREASSLYSYTDKGDWVWVTATCLEFSSCPWINPLKVRHSSPCTPRKEHDWLSSYYNTWYLSCLRKGNIKKKKDAVPWNTQLWAL